MSRDSFALLVQHHVHWLICNLDGFVVGNPFPEATSCSKRHDYSPQEQRIVEVDMAANSKRHDTGDTAVQLSPNGNEHGVVYSPRRVRQCACGGNSVG